MGIELFYAIGAFLLALGLGWGVFAYATRDKSKDAMSERATRQLYKERTPDDAAEPRSPETKPR